MPPYGKKKTHQHTQAGELAGSKDELLEPEHSQIRDMLKLAKLILVLLGFLLNPFNWRKVYLAIYHTWLKRRKQYAKLLEFWSKKEPTTIAGEVYQSLQMTDALIHLERYSEGMNCLKGLNEKIEGADKDQEWKRDHAHKVKFYRSRIHGLAKLRR